MTKKYFFKLFVLSILIFSFVSFNLFAQAKKKTTPKQVAVESLKAIQNENKDFEIEMKIEPEKEFYKTGEEIVIYFKANKDCKLYLLNLSADEKLYIIFPNDFQKDNLIKANTEYRIPPEGAEFRYVIKGPAGTDYLKAIAFLSKDTEIINNDEFKDEGAFQAAKVDTKTIAIEMAEKVNKIDSKKWAEEEITIKIE